MAKQFHSDPTEFGPRISYGDWKEWARVVLDSVGPHGVRVVTVEARYWHAIHAEVMTHRDRSRSVASNRAIPFYREVPCPACTGKSPATRADCEACNEAGVAVSPACMYGHVAFEPFTPEFMGTEQKGMQAGDELTGETRDEATHLINGLRLMALATTRRLGQLGLHKSIVNRYLEPWSYTTTLMTATEWANFFRLRIHPKAERHFDKIARLIREAIRRSEPQQLKVGEWHTPYTRATDPDDIGVWVLEKPGNPRKDAVQEFTNMVSAGRCARLSYLTHDGKRDFGADIELCRKLMDPKADDGSDEPPHGSPAEHVLRCEADPEYRSGPVVGWHQFRKDFARENVSGIGPLE